MPETVTDPITKLEGSLTEDQYCILYPSGQKIYGFMLDSEYEITVNENKQSYDIRIRCRLQLAPGWTMQYTGMTTVLVVECNGQQYSDVGNPTMSIWVTGSNGGTGPWSDWYTFNYPVTPPLTSIRMVTYLDLSSIVGSITGQPGGPDSESRFPGQHYNKLYAEGTVNVTELPVGKAPTLNGLSNNNKYNNNNGVSASTNSISVLVDADFGEPPATVYWSCNGQSGSTTANSFTVTGLSPGVTYTVDVYLQNSIGTSETKQITIRVRNNPPVVSLSLNQRHLEKLVFNWSSDKPLKSTQYRIDSGGWTNLGQTGSSGSFTAQWFSPNTTHTIYFRGVSQDAYDALDSNEASAAGTTYDIGHITNNVSYTFGTSMTIVTSNPSGRPLSVIVKSEGNGRVASFTVSNVRTGSFSFTPNQDQLDAMYKTYPNSNTLGITLQLVTQGERSSYNDSALSRNLVLTGIAKTGHVGVNNNQRRCQIWIGDSSGKARRCVGWVGVNNQARRTI